MKNARYVSTYVSKIEKHDSINTRYVLLWFSLNSTGTYSYDKLPEFSV